MRRGLFGFILASSLVLIWIILGFDNLLLVLIAGVLGYLIAILTGSTRDKQALHSKIIKILQIKE